MITAMDELRRSVIRCLLLRRSTATHPRRDYRCYNLGSLFYRAHHRHRTNRCSSPALLPAVSRRRIDAIHLAPGPYYCQARCTEHILLSSSVSTVGIVGHRLASPLIRSTWRRQPPPFFSRTIHASGQESDLQYCFAPSPSCVRRSRIALPVCTVTRAIPR